MSSVTVVCPNARRCPVKVTPGMLIRQIVEEACLKHGFDVNMYDAFNQKKILDMALPFRLSGLPNNATIELVTSTNKGSGTADIALQGPGGVRKQLTQPVSRTLHDVLISFGNEFGEDLTATVEGAVPSCMFMNKHYKCEELQRTLSSIGITSGKCLIRYQRVQISEEESAAMEARLAEEKRRKQVLEATFEQMRMENAERDRIEAERLKRFEEEVQLREKEEARLRQEQEELEQTQAMDTTENVPARDILGPVTTFQRDRLPTPPPRPQDANAWSFDTPVFTSSAPTAAVAPPTSDRLASLNRLLQHVDSSLTRGTHDSLVDVVAEHGRVSLSQIATAATTMDEDEASNPEPVVRFADPCERHGVVFTKESVSSPVVEPENVSDEFFEVGVDDIRSRQRQLREQVRQQTQRALLPRSFIEKKNRDLKMAAYKNTVLRFIVGSRVVQANFHSNEPASRIFEYFSSILSSPVPFTLSFALNCPIEQSETKNLIDAELSPKTTLFVKFKSAASVDIGTVLKTGGEVKVGSQQEADEHSAQWLSSNSVFHPYTGVTVPDDPRPPVSKRMGTDSSAQHQPPPKSAGPKWLKK